MIFLAIDPGKDLGWATWDGTGRMLACGLGEVRWVGIGLALIERPQVYRAAQSKGDPNDLITLAIQVGELTRELKNGGAKVEHVLPREWKGTIDPDVMSRRIVRDVPIADVATVTAGLRNVPTKKQHNVIDAIGLGLWGFRTGLWRASP